mmetsp:Transcript_14566/g.24167  ORF Transcript_14566/g.24167 Transcript_14566/m.24167 type:complete len:562 (-) Transcript_14566:183-1868(-)
MNEANLERSSLELANGAPLGADCYFQSTCASGYCSSGIFWMGSCVECNNDSHCPGQGESLPGELPVAFCYKGGGGAPPRCSQWKRGEPIDERGYPIWFHGESEAQWIPRIVMDEGPVMEQVWHWDLSNQPDETAFEVTETHVSIPLNAHTIAAYSRTYHNFHEHETGIVTAVFLSNSISVVTPNAVAGMMEKYHTLTYNGTMSTVRADRIREEVAARSEHTKNRAEKVSVQHARGLSMGISIPGVIAEQIEAGQDDMHLDQIRNYIKDLLADGSSLENLESTGWDQHSEEAKQTLLDAKTLSSMKSENHCKHFEEGAGIEVTDTHIVIPLNSAFATLSGEMQFSPTYYLGLNAGVNIAKYDASTNTLEFYYQASQQFRDYSDPKVAPEDLPFPSGIWVSPVNASTPAPSVDGRSDKLYRTSANRGWLPQFLVNSYLSEPVDYSIYDKDMSEACPQDLQEELEPVWLEAKLEEEGESGNLMAGLANMKHLLHVSVIGAPCGSNYMKSDFGPGTVGFELNEFSVWSHMILEVEQEHTEYIATSQFWNDWDEFLKNGEGFHPTL